MRLMRGHLFHYFRGPCPLVFNGVPVPVLVGVLGALGVVGMSESSCHQRVVRVRLIWGWDVVILSKG